MNIVFTWEVNFWQIVTTLVSTGGFIWGVYAAAIRVYYLLDKRMALFEMNLNANSASITQQATRMANYEGQIVGLVGDMQRVIGRLEVLSPMWTGRERRGSASG